MILKDISCDKHSFDVFAEQKYFNYYFICLLEKGVRMSNDSLLKKAKQDLLDQDPKLQKREGLK
jgi:hypothetical protein